MKALWGCPLENGRAARTLSEGITLEAGEMLVVWGQTGRRWSELTCPLGLALVGCGRDVMEGLEKLHGRSRSEFREKEGMITL